MAYLELWLILVIIQYKAALGCRGLLALHTDKSEGHILTRCCIPVSCKPGFQPELCPSVGRKAGCVRCRAGTFQSDELNSTLMSLCRPHRFCSAQKGLKQVEAGTPFSNVVCECDNDNNYVKDYFIPSECQRCKYGVSIKGNNVTCNELATPAVETPAVDSSLMSLDNQHTNSNPATDRSNIAAVVCPILGTIIVCIVVFVFVRWKRRRDTGGQTTDTPQSGSSSNSTMELEESTKQLLQKSDDTVKIVVNPDSDSRELVSEDQNGVIGTVQHIRNYVHSSGGTGNMIVGDHCTMVINYFNQDGNSNSDAVNASTNAQSVNIASADVPDVTNR